MTLTGAQWRQTAGTAGGCDRGTDVRLGGEGARRPEGPPRVGAA